MSLPWKIEVDGADLVIRHARVTCFGGASDPQDDGQTASGVNTKTHPDIVGCALPMRTPSVKNLRDSPLPHLPWSTEVIFTDESNLAAHVIRLVDLGPALYTGNAGDLTVAAARLFNPHAKATNFEMTATIRMIGVAHLFTEGGVK